MFRRLIRVVADEAVHNGNFLRQLLGEDAGGLRDEFWGRMMFVRMRDRLTAIQSRFVDRRDVIDTARDLRRFADAVRRLAEPPYWAQMDDQTKTGFATLLLGSLAFVIDNNMDARVGRTTPAYASQEPHTYNLYRNLIGRRGAGVFAVDVLETIVDSLQTEEHAQRIQLLNRAINQRRDVGRGPQARGGSLEPPASFIEILQGLENGESACSRPTMGQ